MSDFSVVLSVTCIALLIFCVGGLIAFDKRTFGSFRGLTTARYIVLLSSSIIMSFVLAIAVTGQTPPRISILALMLSGVFLCCYFAILMRLRPRRRELE
jgi:hypothetical protein